MIGTRPQRAMNDPTVNSSAQPSGVSRTGDEQCRLLLDPRHESILFYCGEHENPVPEHVQRRLYKRIRKLWAEQAGAD